MTLLATADEVIGSRRGNVCTWHFSEVLARCDGVGSWV